MHPSLDLDSELVALGLRVLELLHQNAADFPADLGPYLGHAVANVALLKLYWLGRSKLRVGACNLGLGSLKQALGGGLSKRVLEPGLLPLFKLLFLFRGASGG